MYLIVDAYNVLHTTGILPPDLAGVEVDGLARLILGSRYYRRRSLLVCDGTPAASRKAVGGEAHMLGLVVRVPGETEPGDLEHATPRIAVHYAGPGRDADTVIHGLIRASSSPARLTIVSTDREIRRHAMRRRARTIVSESFLKHLSEDFREYQRGTGTAALAYEIPLDTGSIEWWLYFFRMDEPERLRLDELLDSTKHPPHDQETRRGQGPEALSEQAPREKRRGKPEWWARRNQNGPDTTIDVDSIDTGDFLD